MGANEVAILVKARDEATKVLGDVEQKAGGLGKTLGDVGKVAAGFLAANVIGEGFTKLTGAIGDSIAGFKEHLQVVAQTEAVIKSTGGAAGLSAKEIEDMANAFKLTSLYEDDAIQSSQNVLLTFTNIGRDVFPRAEQAILDMSQALGQDLQSSTIQLGKALNDPIKGITALSRVGVSFTSEQKEQIKVLTESGDVMGAQALILAELEKEFGGSAKAASDAAGASATYADRMDDLQDTIGEKLLPIQEKFKEAQVAIISFMVDKALPVIEQMALWLGEKLGPAFDAAGKFVSGTLEHIEKFVGDVQWIIENGGGLADIVAGDGSMATNWDKLAVATSNAIVNFQQFRDEIQPAIETAVRFIVTKVTELSAHLQTHFARFPAYYEENVRPALENIMRLVQKVVEIFQQYWPQIMAIVQPILDELKNQIETAVTIITGVLNILILLLKGDFSGAWEAAKQLVADVAASMVESVTNAKDLIIAVLTLLKDIGGALMGELADLVGGAFDRLRDGAIDRVNQFKDGVVGAFHAVKDAVIGVVVDTVNSVLDWFGSLVAKIVGMVNSVIGRVNGAIGAINSALNFTVSFPGIDPPGPGSIPGFSQTINAGVLPTIPQLATGTPYVPRDMLAYLHKGEAVVPAGMNGGMTVQVFVGNREITDIVDVRIVENQSRMRRSAQLYGAA